MSRVCFNEEHKLRLASFLTGAAVLIAVAPAASQEAGLRGAVSEAEVTSRLVAQGAAGISSPPYQPITPAPPDSSLFPNAASDPFASFNAPPAARPPSTATERARRREQDGADQERLQPVAEQQIDDLPTGNTRAVIVDALAPSGTEVPARLNQPATPIEGLPRRWEEAPYAPSGLRIGTFVLIPQLEQGLTWTSNASDTPGGDEALMSETSLRLGAASDWSRHSASANAFGTIRRSLSGDEISEAEGGADVRLDVDISESMRGTGALAYSARREGASSPVIISGVEKQPLRHTIEAALGLERSLGPVRIGMIGEVLRNQFGDAKLAGGGRLSQSERNSILAVARLRSGYEISPALIPFVEVQAGRRIYDDERDSAGYARSALRLGARAGIAFDLSEKLNGEISAGWISEDLDDDRLQTISGLALGAILAWSPQRGTIVSLNANTVVEGTTAPGESGSLLHYGTLEMERQLRSNLTGNLALGLSYRDYAAGGHDLIMSGEAGLTWWLNRYAGLTSRARHERQTSSLRGREYETTSVFMGVRLQR
ncbi:outer membrane beta-barrel protein [Chelativorans sp. Marseille-P2723]|uniref:outer membrane beta-barrel protein n=1 Tax=Chelativorans sp. Marseille-P2723 TaxID=2709133 RepID=UPI00156EAF60|nr:outer membrane beta-barrel protein [Chelativorans sp. Marseille-P2723]